jgi:hypothetical protein
VKEVLLLEEYPMFQKHLVMGQIKMAPSKQKA